MFHVFFDLYDGPHALTNDTGGQFSWLKDFMKVISVANRNSWLKSKIHMIRMIIVDEIVVRKRIGMRVFAFGKLACEYFPIYLEMARKLAVEEASAILGTTVKYDILFPSEKTGELPSVGGKIKCSDRELQHVCMADRFMSLDHRARLDGAIAFVCKDLLAGKCVTYFQSLSSRYGNYSESELRELRKDQWANRSDEYKLKWSEDKQKWWDDQSDEYKLKWSEDKQKWWDDQSDEYKLKWSEDEKRRWDERSDEYKQEWSEDKQKWWDEDGKRRQHDLRKISSGSTEEETYYAIDGANEDGTYILITEIFGTNDLNFSKKVKRRNGKKVTTKFHTMETINELHLKKCATKTCINNKKARYEKCNKCLGYF
jgi:hypothetical protein